MKDCTEINQINGSTDSEVSSSESGSEDGEEEIMTIKQRDYKRKFDKY